MLAELEALARATERAARLGSDRPSVRIACPADLGDDQQACGRTLRLAAGQAEVRCRSCGSSWQTGWLITVALDAGADAWADPDAVALLVGHHVTTLRRWARKGLVRRRGHGRGMLYSVADCHAVASGVAA
jgi:hypothetical protein